MALLRESGQHGGEPYDLRAVNGEAPDGGGIPHGSILVALAEAAVSGEPGPLAEAREAVTRDLGAAALVDAAAVVAVFGAAVRVADATGIPLEEAKAEATGSVRAELGIDAYPGATGGAGGP